MERLGGVLAPASQALRKKNIQASQSRSQKMAAELPLDPGLSIPAGMIVGASGFTTTLEAPGHSNSTFLAKKRKISLHLSLYQTMAISLL